MVSAINGKPGVAADVIVVVIVCSGLRSKLSDYAQRSPDAIQFSAISVVVKECFVIVL